MCIAGVDVEGSGCGGGIFCGVVVVVVTKTKNCKGRLVVTGAQPQDDVVEDWKWF